jgi:hypothetical protein
MPNRPKNTEPQEEESSIATDTSKSIVFTNGRYPEGTGSTIFRSAEDANPATIDEVNAYILSNQGAASVIPYQTDFAKKLAPWKLISVLYPTKSTQKHVVDVLHGSALLDSRGSIVSINHDRSAGLRIAATLASCYASLSADEYRTRSLNKNRPTADPSSVPGELRTAAKAARTKIWNSRRERSTLEYAATSIIVDTNGWREFCSTINSMNEHEGKQGILDGASAEGGYGFKKRVEDLARDVDLVFL